MKQMGRLTSLIAALLLPLLISGQALAAANSITQELTVTAVVPAHRDIITDRNGDIVRITSNTKDDVVPDVYLEDTIPENKRPLTAELYAQYRDHVPEGTARYGVLYTRPAVRLTGIGGLAQNQNLAAILLTNRFM